MKTSIRTGTMIALASATLFAAACNKDKAAPPSSTTETKDMAKPAADPAAAPAPAAAAAAPAAAPAAQPEKVAKIHCGGANDCKGKSGCKTASNACAGQNGCKGKGYVELSPEECQAKGGKAIDDK
jgi:hypothetical protein